MIIKKQNTDELYEVKKLSITNREECGFGVCYSYNDRYFIIDENKHTMATYDDLESCQKVFNQMIKNFNAYELPSQKDVNKL